MKRRSRQPSEGVSRVPRATMLAALRAHGGALEVADDGVNLVAPPGHLWTAANAHALLVLLVNENDDPLTPREKERAYKDGLDRMAQGLYPCDIEDCDCAG